MSAQIKSKQRVQEYGEVFTNEREVKRFAIADYIKFKTCNVCGVTATVVLDINNSIFP